MLLPEELTTGVIELVYLCIATENPLSTYPGVFQNKYRQCQAALLDNARGLR
jgi:hypothetical protein